MHHSHTNAPDAVTRFFDNYLKCLHKASIPEKQRRWYVIRLEAFIKAHSERKIKSLTGQDIHQYLDMIGRQNNLAGWQFYQCVDAIRILYCAQFSSPACKDVDWEFWRNSARQLDIDHPSTARQLTPEELGYLKEKNSTGPLQETRRSNRDLLRRLASEIRRRSYAYRTEQTYEQWGFQGQFT